MTDVSRRRFVGGLGALAASGLAGCKLPGLCGCGDSTYDGIQVGAITFSFYRMPIGPGSALMYLREAGLTHCELMGYDLEVEAGAPVWKCPWDQTSEDQAERAEWRAKVDMKAFADVRAKYDDAGVSVHILKPECNLTNPEKVSDAEIDYWCRCAKAMGARCLTCEMPSPKGVAGCEKGLRRVATFLEKHDLLLAFHNHTQLDATFYDGPLLGWSDRFRINFDIGHYVAANEDDPLAFVKKYHDKIFSIHLKDRTTKARKARTTVFGEGDVPFRDLFALMQREGYAFPCDIEMEYVIPVGSDAVRETSRARRYCRSVID